MFKKNQSVFMVSYLTNQEGFLMFLEAMVFRCIATDFFLKDNKCTQENQEPPFLHLIPNNLKGWCLNK